MANMKVMEQSPILITIDMRENFLKEIMMEKANSNGLMEQELLDSTKRVKGLKVLNFSTLIKLK